MYFKTKRDSETGVKFSQIENKKKEVKDALDLVIKKYGAHGLCGDRWAAFGGCEVLIFDNAPDTSVWKKSNEINNGYKPKLNTVKGKEIKKYFDSVPKISKKEVNMCIGFNEDMFKTIGYSFANPEYYLFQVSKDWGIDIPLDCEEVTQTEYDSLCKA